jgi:uncharacterized RDD family membrane protein YckC
MNEQEYAGFWIRTWAQIIDSFLVGLIGTTIFVAIHGADILLLESFFKGFWGFIYKYILPAIVVIIFWIYKSATPGKMITKLVIVDAKTGEKPSTGQFINRYLGYYFSMIPLCFGFIWVGIDKKNKDCMIRWLEQL